MSKLNAKQEKAIPTKEFGLPEKRAYPMPDRKHAANAKARAEQMEEKAELSSADKTKIDRKADKVLRK